MPIEGQYYFSYEIDLEKNLKIKNFLWSFQESQPKLEPNFV